MRARSRRGLVLVGAISILACPGVASAAERSGSKLVEVQAAADAPRGDGTLGKAARMALRHGPLVPDREAYAQAKARAQADATFGPVTAPTAGPLAPATVRGWNGVFDSNSAPSDSTSAVGTTRFIELVNRKFAIYNKTSNTPISQGTLSALAGVSETHNTFDPQVIWDPQQARFFYAMDDVVSETSNNLAFGFSKGPSPNGAADFCHYLFSYGSEFPDYPKLGDTQHFITMGVNTFSGNSFVGSDVAWVTKPPAGNLATCPSAGSFGGGVEFGLEDQASNGIFTPVAVNQTDTSPTGYVVARSGGLPATFLSLHRVTRNADGTANIQSPGQNVNVPSYTVPADAPQPGTPDVLDTLDGRPTQAISGIDPRFGASGVNAIWTQHTIAGTGGRSVVRWYEINPVARTRLQTGTIQNANQFIFNGAISPDRGVRGATKVGGSNMVTGVSTSSSSSNPAIRMASKIGAGAQSGLVPVRNSSTFYDGFDCGSRAPNLCRWGDYSGATPEPNPPSGQTRVWLTNQWVASDRTWRTWNWVARP